MKKYKIVNKFKFYSFITISLAIILFLVLLFFNIGSSLGSNFNKIEYEYYTIRDNDTVWKIAEKYNNKKIDIRDFVSIIIDENDLFDSNIIPGEKIRIPMI
ncbi:cell division suppressor protein YneA [Miniphocaeibacter halophilus]|uniref:LysM peptidoglycan-binding domain-containing protein n=1 Tax=Miniphocaeibacter halophilus TaxID=2931922 RepID=A0AC61MPW0_9FIRM|nr:LysM peptidoglycan-binding domain-containing protein [Miniphocaeibacter halophilus]QQK07612.1 LysM peptidoglycan-binding domain-containing protein [Miniphocaeibacter halophilus]